jgi:hypothetical protein
VIVDDAIKKKKIKQKVLENAIRDWEASGRYASIVYALKLLRDGYDARVYFGIKPKRPGPVPSDIDPTYKSALDFLMLRDSWNGKQEGLRRYICSRDKIGDSTLRAAIRKHREKCAAAIGRFRVNAGWLAHYDHMLQVAQLECGK